VESQGPKFFSSYEEFSSCQEFPAMRIYTGVFQLSGVSSYEDLHRSFPALGI